MSKVSVLDQQKQVLEPCHPAVARRLLRAGQAAVYKRYPFTIILKREVAEPKTEAYTLSVDPGSKCTGVAITDSERTLIASFELHHRGSAIKKNLQTKAGYRRSRRTRKLRHREARFENRSRKSPRLKNGVWVYENVKNTRKTENTFNRVSNAMLKDKRYAWIKIDRKKPLKSREKTRLYFASGKRIRGGDLYYEKDGSLYPYNSNNAEHRAYKPSVYSPKSYPIRKRWRRVFKGEDTAPRDADGHRIHNGWIAPSLMSRVFNIETLVRRLCAIYPIKEIAVEHVKFDTQLMAAPEISGVEYQQGTLYAAEVWEYLLEKFKRKCFYCGKKNVPLEKEHIVPKAKGGTNRVDNLTISCRDCNTKKGNRHPNEIEGAFGKRVQQALRAAQKPLKDAQAVNTIRWKIVETLQATGLPIVYGTGGKTKFHRKQAGLPKTHYYDAACVAGVPKKNAPHPVLAIHAVGYGHRQDLGNFQTIQNAPGFKRPYTRIEHASGFQKMDMVEMLRENGKVIGCINSFDKTPENKPQRLRIQADWTGTGLFTKDGRVSGRITQLRKIQKRDGYAYQIFQAKPLAYSS